MTVSSDDEPLEKASVPKRKNSPVRDSIGDNDDMYLSDSPVHDVSSPIVSQGTTSDVSEFTPLQPRRTRSIGHPFAGQRALFSKLDASLATSKLNSMSFSYMVAG